jgi:hypothetical protein
LFDSAPLPLTTSKTSERERKKESA